MPKRKVKAIADAADMVVDGFAVSCHELGYRIVNLNTGHVVVMSKDFKVIESSMDAIEEAMAERNIKENLEFMVA